MEIGSFFQVTYEFSNKWFRWEDEEFFFLENVDLTILNLYKKIYVMNLEINIYNKKSIYN